MKKSFAVLCTCLCFCPFVLRAQSPLPAASALQSCPIHSAPPSEADQLLSRGKNKEAQAAYKALMQKAPTDEHARLGVIRAVLEQDRIGHTILLPAALKPTGNLHYIVLDTGAQSSMFSLPLANEAGQLRATSTRFIGISGKTKTVYVTQDTALYIGSLHLLPDSYYATDLTNISNNNGFEVGGFFGLNTLQRLTLQLDYRDNLIKLTYDPKRDVVRF